MCHFIRNNIIYGLWVGILIASDISCLLLTGGGSIDNPSMSLNGSSLETINTDMI